MAETTIEWTGTRLADGTMLPGFTFNPWIGCEKVSDACKFCYASVHTYARVSASRGLPLWGPGSSRHVTSDANWRKPIGWNREAERSGIRRKVFCASLADVFEDRPDLAQPRARLARLISDTPALDWLLLTKRPENAQRLWQAACDQVVRDELEASGLSAAESFATAIWGNNVWLGTTVESQAMAEKRIPALLRVPAAVRFLSVEPLLGSVDVSQWLRRVDVDWEHFIGPCKHGRDPWTRCELDCDHSRPALDWVIGGGESGPKARPMHPAWARSLRDQCTAAGVPFLFKQWGDWAPYADDERDCSEAGETAANMQTWMTPDGESGGVWLFDGDGSWSNWTGTPPEDMAGVAILNRWGKKRAGRMLDGREWNGFPAVHP